MHNAFHQRIRDDAPYLMGDHAAPDGCAAVDRYSRALDESHGCSDRAAKAAALEVELAAK